MLPREELKAECPLRVNVGCGRSPTEGWLNFDNSPSLRLAKIPLLPMLMRKTGLLDAQQQEFIRFAAENGIRYGDATRRFPLASGSVDALYSSHMMEHLDRNAAAKFLQEAARVLRPGGIIRIVVPDLKKLVDRYSAMGDADEFMESTLLYSPDPRTLAQRIRLLYSGLRNHRWMYDGPSLTRLLRAHGFKSVAIVGPGETRIPDPGELDLAEREEESVYAEAERP